MPVKFKLGSRPKSFKKTINVQMHDGVVGQIKVEYFYRTRREFGEFIDEILADAGVKPASDSDEDVKFSLREAMDKSIEANADYIMKAVSGWDLDVDYTRDAVIQLCDESPGAAFGIINSYREACIEGKLGN